MAFSRMVKRNTPSRLEGKARFPQGNVNGVQEIQEHQVGLSCETVGTGRNYMQNEPPVKRPFFYQNAVSTCNTRSALKCESIAASSP